MPYKNNTDRNARAKQRRLENPDEVRAAERVAKKKWRGAPEVKEKEHERNRIWYSTRGGKESTRKRKGYVTREEYLALVEERRLKSIEAKRLHSASEAGKRTRCARTIYRKFRHLGFTIDLYDEMYERQDGKCRICRIDRPKYGQLRMHIDHCHAQNKVRALLCSNCNAGLGHFKDHVDVLKSAIAFLEEHSA